MQNNKTTIYYFSGTGNSLYIAKSLKEKLDDCELIPIASLINQNSVIATSEKVGFISPVHCRGVPKIVYDFIKRIDLSKSKYLFALVTKGAPFEQLTIQVLNTVLQPKGKELDATFEIRVFSNNIIGTALYNPLPSKEKREKKIRKSELKLEKIAEVIRNNKKGKRSKVAKLHDDYKSYLQEGHNEDEHYYSDEKCNGCGICQKICPVDNIKLVDEKPVWQHKCQSCLACIHYCPQKAIEYGKISLNRDRYNHPYITLKELINQKQGK